MITRPRVPQSYSLFTDLGVLATLAAVIYGLVRVARHWEAPLAPQFEISLSLWALPGYTLQSALRGFIAYGFSMIFAITYGYIAAHRPRAEKIMLPLLDVLQSIPVLGFLPGLVLGLIALFPRTNVGLELACILMIFTGQVWNMAFSFYQSVRSIPLELREASSIYHFNWWQKFFRVEMPAAAVSFAWNSMMAMAGGWFFLMIVEAFTLGGHDFRLPGLGSYMSVAIAHHDVKAIVAGIVAMVLMIVVIDTFVWKPVIVYAQRFRMEETAQKETQGSFVLDWLRRSWIMQTARARVARPVSDWLFSGQQELRDAEMTTAVANGGRMIVQRIFKGTMILAGGLAVVYGAWKLGHLLGHVPIHEWVRVLGGAVLTMLRVFATIIIGTLWTIPVGIWIGESDRRRNFLQPVVQVAASFPAPMLYPLVLEILHFFGLRLGVGSIILMLLGTQWYILFNVIAGVSSIPHEFREVAEMYHFTWTQKWRAVLFPAIFPFLITGWVTAAGGAWNASIVAEYTSLGKDVFVAPGLGSLISLAASHGHYDLLAAGILTMSTVVIFLNRILWKPLYRLAETRYSY